MPWTPSDTAIHQALVHVSIADAVSASGSDLDPAFGPVFQGAVRESMLVLSALGWSRVTEELQQARHRSATGLQPTGAIALQQSSNPNALQGNDASRESLLRCDCDAIGAIRGSQDTFKAIADPGSSTATDPAMWASRLSMNRRLEHSRCIQLAVPQVDWGGITALNTTLQRFDRAATAHSTRIYASGGLVAARMASRGLDMSVSQLIMLDGSVSAWDGGVLAVTSHAGHDHPATSGRSVSVRLT